jgi:resuscitation-promoting factor RpfA
VRIDIETKALSVGIGAAGVLAAFMISAPPAMADPVIPAPPAPAPADPVAPAPAPGPEPGPGPGPGPETTLQAADAAAPATPADGVPHLSSPDNLPPGTSETPVDQGQPRTLGYLRDLWHAVQTQEVSGGDALLLLTQRPLDANAAPPPGMPANPTPPLPPAPDAPPPTP